jgi:hypothetical protein
MKSRLYQIMKWAYDSLGHVASDKRCWQAGAPVVGQQFEYPSEDIDDRKTAGRGGGCQRIPNSGTPSLSTSNHQ